MKNNYLTLLLVCSCFLGFSQVDSTKVSFSKNEIKANGILVLAGFPEVSFERLLNEQASFGTSIGVSLVTDAEIKFMFTPYYRQFFGKGIAKGFFVEGFASLNSIKVPEEKYYAYDPIVGDYIANPSDSYIDFALGLGIGAKWISKNNVIFELNAGLGRNLRNNDKNDFYDHTFIGRGGLSIGYRF